MSPEELGARLAAAHTPEEAAALARDAEEAGRALAAVRA